MSGTASVPNTFQSAVTATGLQLDQNYSTIIAYLNDPTNRNNYAADSGTTATFAIALSPAPGGYTAGLGITFKLANANAAAAQVNVNGLGAKNLIDQNGQALIVNAYPANAIVNAVYNGSAFVAISAPYVWQGGIANTLTITVGAINTGKFNDGTTSAPSITFASDTNTGFYSGGADILVTVNGGVERQRTNATGYSKFSNTGSYIGAAGDYHEFGSTANDGSAVLNLVHNGATATNQFGEQVRLAGDPNNTTCYFFSGVGNATERITARANGGLANFSANNVNLSDRSVKPVFERYTPEVLDRLAGALDGVDWGRYKYADQTHDDWNHGPTAQGVLEAFSEAAPELVDEWQPGDKKGLLAIYTHDLMNIAIAVLLHRIKKLEGR